MQKQSVKKNVWEFVCQGTFNPELFKDTLSIRFAEFARGTHNFLYCYIKVVEKRAEQIEKIFTEYDKEVPDGMRIKLTNLPCEPAMVGFGRGNEYANHVIYKEIKELQRKGDPSYKVWTPALSAAQAERARIALYQQNFEVQDRVMDEDPAAFGLDDESMDEGTEDDDPVVIVTPAPVSTQRQVPLQRQPVQPPLQRPAEQAFNQTTIESFFKRTGEKLEKIDNEHQETSKSIAGSLHSIESLLVDNFDTSNAKLDDVKKIVVDLVKQREEESRASHFEHMSYQLRGQLGAQAAQENKPLHAEIASLKRKLDDKDKTIGQLHERLEGIEATQTAINRKLDQLLEKTSSGTDSGDYVTKLEFLFKAHMGNLDWDITDGQVRVNGLRRRVRPTSD